MLIFLVDIGEGGHVESQFPCAVETFGIMEFVCDHLLEASAWKENDAHLAQLHLYVGLDAIPIGSESKGFCVEIDSGFIVSCEKAYGVEFESCHFLVVLIFVLMAETRPIEA